MFPASKLGELSHRTRLRKIARILQGIEIDAAGGRPPDPGYLRDVLRHLGKGMPAAVEEAAAVLAGMFPCPIDSPALIRGVNALRHAILSTLHAEPAEWDLVDARTGLLDRSGLDALP